ncbi:MAG: TlpA family protein disulfide reductase [Rhodospirillales bacterium]|nr:TlpA family protein disulfide reductase [Acetobacter sp.]
MLFLLGSCVAAGCDRGGHPEQLGRLAPSLALSDGEHAIDLHALRGQVVLLNFWASWCAPCVTEMPSLQALQQELPEIKVVGIAFNEDAVTYRAFLARRPVSFLTVLDETGQAHSSFGTFRPPETYIIDKSGIIRRKYIGAQDWTSVEIVSSLRKMAGA